ncbi:HD domain-containing protein [Sciscionella sediminilitoris]|uniref:HD domain-containing protein n=1 Tax=Sciscionella sediminilitoris TaxID=1445613 RepID=UPI0004DF7317|nr:HD domain-containing protein [Sciscionella sp. SE31]
MDLVRWARKKAQTKLETMLPRRWAHVQGVGARAAVAGALFPDDEAELLTAAGLLHDIGYAPELAHTQFHPLDGARYLAATDAPERLVHLVAHHSCAYREAELRDLGGDLAEFTDETTPLRDALWWADMTTTPDGRVTTVDQRLNEIQARYGPTDLVTSFIHAACSELTAAVNRTEERLTEAGIVYA